MQLRDALDRLDTIHDHLARAEEYRGFRAAGVALVGVFALLAPAIRPHLAPDTAGGFVRFWVLAAAGCAILAAGPAVFAYLRSEDALARRRTRRVAAQFLPCVAAGAALTAALTPLGPHVVSAFPGLWALTFGLGVVAARPYLPPAVGPVGLFYLAAGCLLLAWGAGRADPSDWAVAGVFGPGHLAAAAALARGRREEGDDA